MRTLVLGLPQQVVMSITVLDTLEALDRELAQLGVQLHLAALPEEASVVAARTLGTPGWWRRAACTLPSMSGSGPRRTGRSAGRSPG